jgi:DNA topoisomerase-2
MVKVKVNNKYIKLDPREHVLTRPGMYIGSLDSDNLTTYIFENDKMIKKNISFTPGLYKIFDEILVNAIDHCIRLKQDSNTVNQVKNIKINIDKESGSIEVFNDGDSIDVLFHDEYQMYIPEMIFGNLMTSSNYNDDEERIIGGQNGIGAKACNIFSSKFSIEIVDHKTHKLYQQEWTNNMSNKTEPKLSRCVKKPYTKITFTPDYEKLNTPNRIDDNLFAFFKKRCYDICALTHDTVNVFFNGEKLMIKNFEKYVDLYIGSKSDCGRVYKKIDDRWEIVVAYNENSGFEHVSFVNGIWTMRGGKHVDYISNQICSKLVDLINKRKKVDLKPQYIKNSLTIFIKCIISNPTFDSQTKDLLTTPMTKFGSKPDIDEAFIDKICKIGLIDNALNLSSALDDKMVKKTDGKKQNTIRNMPKLDDAKFAGTIKGNKCTLILTEGDSAKAMALAGLDVVGRDYYGVFPLRGKLLNVKDCTLKKISENEEISNIKKILGLESGKKYNSIDELRYGKVMIMTDADEDGYHIKGLLFNLFHTLWPSLFQKDDFICSLKTPIIKARKNKQCIEFYHLSEYEKWKSQCSDLKSWYIKYYKGLATSTSTEAKEYFKQMKTTTYSYNEESSDNAIELAFNKKLANDRKSWLSNYDYNNIIDNNNTVVYEDYVNKELIHFSNYDIERSIPNICDGLKISQRKILFGCHKRNLTQEIRVAQLASYVSEHTSYHHGEASLQTAIINMAQDFVGSNNINVLYPNGQFGTRVQGGKDAGSPRYIYTYLSKITSKIYKNEDDCILEYLNDDGYSIEPRVYYPIIPMILVNGAIGIGTGFSTNIPCYNPLDIISYLMQKLKGSLSNIDLIPWYRGFKGTIEKDDQKDRYMCIGKYNRVGKDKLEITELPIGTWTHDYKEFLESIIDKYIKSYNNNSSNDKVHFQLHFQNEQKLNDLLSNENFETMFKLRSNRISSTNMYLFNHSGQITKYNTVYDIIDSFYDIRLNSYVKRKEHIEKRIKDELKLLSDKIRFLDLVIDRELILHEKTKDELESDLIKYEFDKRNDSYDYLLKMPIYSMTKDKQIDLKDEHLKKTEKLNDVINTTANTMWYKELDELYKEIENHYV